MNRYICLDSCVWMKYLTWEEGSEEAQRLLEKVIESRLTVVMPDFAWAEIASVFRKKVRAGLLTDGEADTLWEAYRGLGIVAYIQGEELMDAAWRIAREEALPTVYDAAYLAVAELYSAPEETCEFWTTDAQLARAVKSHGRHIRLLGEEHG